MCAPACTRSGRLPRSSPLFRPDRADRRSVEVGPPPDHELVPARTDAYHLYRRSTQLFHPLDVGTAIGRKVLPGPAVSDGLFPAGHPLVARLAVLQVRDVGHRMVVKLAAEVVADTDLNVWHLVQDVQFRQSH